MTKLNEKKTGGYLLNTIVSAAVIALSVMAPQLGASVKGVTILWQLCYFIILSCSLNLVIGFLGQLSLGHCGFMGVGAYAAALISLAFQRAGFYSDKAGAAFLLVVLICVLASGVCAALVGLLVGIPALRMYISCVLSAIGKWRRDDRGLPYERLGILIQRLLTEGVLPQLRRYAAPGA